MDEEYISRSIAVAARLLGNEMMIMSATDSTLFHLNKMGTIIWLAADGKTSLSEIVRSRICPGRKVDPDTAYRDAKEFVDALAQHGVLSISNQPLDR
jgi:hypothetical protein